MCVRCSGVVCALCEGDLQSFRRLLSVTQIVLTAPAAAATATATVRTTPLPPEIMAHKMDLRTRHLQTQRGLYTGVPHLQENAPP